MKPGSYKKVLARPGMWSYLTTEFLGAFNDNLYRFILSFLAVRTALSAFINPELAIPLIGAVFTIPFLLFSGYAGLLADRFNKRSVLIATKIFEPISMALAMYAMMLGNFPLMLFALFCMTTQSTFFSPAKYGILPEIFAARDLSRANGLVEMSTKLAIILGTVVSGYLTETLGATPLVLGLVLLGIAVVGVVSSFGIPNPHIEAPDLFKTDATISGAPLTLFQKLNPWQEIVFGMRRILEKRALIITVFGSAWFWFFAAFVQQDVLIIGKFILQVDDFHTSMLAGFLGAGVGIGNVVAGRLSGDKIEMGLVPFGAIGMFLSSLYTYYALHSLAHTAVSLALIGFFSGFFIVPLSALLQYKCATHEKGRVIATATFLSMAAVLIAFLAQMALHDWLGIPVPTLLCWIGWMTVALTVAASVWYPTLLIRFVSWTVSHTIYRVRIDGAERIPTSGPVVLVSNHISFMDGLLICGSMQRFVRFFVHPSALYMQFLKPFFRFMGAIPISAREKDIARALEQARRALEQGHMICIFDEGGLTRTSKLLPFRRGIEKIVEGLNVPVIPVYLDRVWGKSLTWRGGKVAWKFPLHLPQPITVAFGKILPPNVSAETLRQAIAKLSIRSVHYRPKKDELLHFQFFHVAKQQWWKFCMSDINSLPMTYGRVMIGSLLLGEKIKDLGATAQNVGIFLPASAGGAIANIAVLVAGNVPVNLNFTLNAAVLEESIRQSRMQVILTSRKFLQKLEMAPLEGMVFLEDLAKTITAREKFWTALKAFCLPSRMLINTVQGGDFDQSPHELATILFSSGSTGTPKGVMLSHHNVISNVESILQAFWTTPEDRMLGVLPLFHAFGFTATLWLPLLSGMGVVYHFNPLDSKNIGWLAKKYRATFLIGTPTFLQAYTRACSPDQFQALRYVIAGAEKLSPHIAKAFKEKFNLDILEGYGCTELGPAVAVNVPDTPERMQRTKGSVGQPLPNVTLEIVDPATFEPMPQGEEGLLLVKSPSRMMGYLDNPKATEEALHKGWYITGDIARVDEGGFLYLVDRLSRFSKIGGEMVPHMKVEDEVDRILGGAASIIVSVQDSKKGERLVVLYTHETLTPDAVYEQLMASDLPNLWRPKASAFFRVDALPLLGTGKKDLGGAKKLALQLAGEK